MAKKYATDYPAAATLTGAELVQVVQVGADAQVTVQDIADLASGGGGTGDVVGPASSVNNRVAAFDGTTGKLLKDSGVLFSDLAPKASPALTGTPTAPTATAGTSTTQIATTAFVRTPSVQSVASSATVTPTWTNDLVTVTAQAANLTLANPTGTASDGLGFVVRIKDNGTARTISYGSQYRAIGITLPTTTVISKTLYLAGIWNAADSTVDVLSVAQQA